MSVPTWLNQAAPNSNGSPLAAEASSMAFSRPPTAASFDPSQLQYQDMQLRMQNGSIRHGSPSSQSPMYNTQNMIPAKRSRPREGSTGGLAPSYSSGSPAPRMQTPQGTNQGFQANIHGGPQFRGSAPYQPFQQQNHNSNQSPLMQPQIFSPHIMNPAVHRTSLSPFSPGVQGFGAQNSTSPPDHLGGAGPAPRGSQLYPPYGSSQGRAHATNMGADNAAATQMPITQSANPQNLNPRQQQMYAEARARQIQQGQSHVQSNDANFPRDQPNASSNSLSLPIDVIKDRQTTQMQRQAQAGTIAGQGDARPDHMDRMLRTMIQYMHSKRLSFDPRPVIATESVSCVHIFLLGMKLGGSMRIDRLAQWSKLAELLSIPRSNLTSAGQEIQVYWDGNLVRWECHFMKLQQSKLPHQRAQGRSQHRHLPLSRHKQQDSSRPRIIQPIVRPETMSMDENFKGVSKKATLKRNSQAALPKIASKHHFLSMIEEGAFRKKGARETPTGISTNSKSESKDAFMKLLANDAFRKTNANRFPQKKGAENAFPKTKATVKDLVPGLIAKGGFPKTMMKNLPPVLMRKSTFSKRIANSRSRQTLAKGTSKIKVNDTAHKTVAQDTVPAAHANDPFSTEGAEPSSPKFELRSPRPLLSYYTPKVHALDPSIYKPKGHGKESEASETGLRTEYHGGLPISDLWFRDTLDSLIKYKHSTPQLNELGVIDIRALILSMKSGINGEVRLALDVIAALSHERPPPLHECEELLDTLIDFASDQIEILAEGSFKSSEVLQLLSHEEQTRGFKTQSYMLQEVPTIGSRSHDLSRAADRLVGVTTILRNLSLRPDNQESLREPSIIRMITTSIRYLGTRHLFLRTHQNTLDFSKDIVTFLGALSPYINLTSKEDGLAILQFLLSFAPEPRPKIKGDKIAFAIYVPMMHRYLPHAVDALAKLIARDPNRALYRSMFATETFSSPPFDLLTRAFGLSVSVIPDFGLLQGRGKGVIAVRSPIIAQGLLSAEILVGMLPTSAHDVAYSWLGSQDGFVPRLKALLDLLSTTLVTEMQRRPDGTLAIAYDLDIGYQMINSRGLALLKNLANRAQDAAAFEKDFSPNVYRLNQSANPALGSNKDT